MAELNKRKQIAEALSGLSYKEWMEISQIIDSSYHEIKKELTSEEISSKLSIQHSI